MNCKEDFTDEMIDVFRQSLERHINEVEQEGAAAFTGPEFFEGYLERMKELRDFLSL